MTEPTESHFRQVAMLIDQGAVTPFLGAGVNLCDREPEEQWERGKRLPSGADLAAELARLGYPHTEPHKLDLLRVSQFVAASLGEDVLYESLRRLFNAKYPPSSVHEFLAALPARIRELRRTSGEEIPYQLILTTNYDFALETAFDNADEPYDVLWYEAKETGSVPRGKFWHRPPGENVEPVPVIDPSEHEGLSLEERTIIVKLHGAVDPKNTGKDSFVISEDDYIAYLSAGDISAAIPAAIKARMTQTNFLFLGYSMSDWNLRVVLSRVWGMQALPRNSWALQLRPDDPKDEEIETQLWRKRYDNRVLPLYSPLKDYVARLERTVAETSTVVV